MIRKPSEKQLRLLAEVAYCRVRRSQNGWMIASQPARGAEATTLRALREHGWIVPVHEPQEPMETAVVNITDAGLTQLATYWPHWTPPAPQETDPAAQAPEQSAMRAMNPPR